MPGVEQSSDDVFKGTTFALVIGISKYLHGQHPDEGDLNADEFRNLKCAARDAMGFVQYLRRNGVARENVVQLYNHQATLTRIKHELDNLNLRCRDEQIVNPLVFFYFSGHGAIGYRDRRYLLPYESDPKRLHATAFWNKHFKLCLDELENTRLVVFLDACHSGGLGTRGKAAETTVYDFEGGLETSDRYIIGSSLPTQRSYERKDGRNGIFTYELLELLKGTRYDFPAEEIDLLDVLKKLSDSVKTAAWDEHREHQEPAFDIRKRTNITVAINWKLREQRIRQDALLKRRRLDFIDYLCKHIEGNKKPVIRILLSQYIEKGERILNYEDCYQVFDFHVDTLHHPNEGFCRLLLLAFDSVTQAIPSRPVESNAQTEIANFSTSPVTVLEPRSTLPPPLPNATPRRQFSQQQQEHIMKDLVAFEKYATQKAQLQRSLSDLIDPQNFELKLKPLREELKDDEQALNELSGISKRFLDCWREMEKTKEQLPRRAADLQLQK